MRLLNVFIPYGVTALYFGLVSPVIARFIRSAVKSYSFTGEFLYFAFILGAVLIVAQILETYAFSRKMNYVHRALKLNGGLNGEGESAIILWFFHMAVSVIMMFAAFSLFGIDPTYLAEESSWFTVIVILIVIKEIYLLFAIIGIHDESDTLEKYSRPNDKEWIFDLILLFYSWFVYTATWSSISLDTPIDKSSVFSYGFDLFLAAVLFLIFYLPIRIPQIIESRLYLKLSKDYLIYFGSFAVVVLSVIFSL